MQNKSGNFVKTRKKQIKFRKKRASPIKNLQKIVVFLEKL
jgi:hypothetical protein